LSKFPPDDDRLVEFLRQHKGTPPPAAPNLEVKLLQSLKTNPRQPAWYQRWQIAPPAIAAGLLVAWSSYHLLVATVEPIDSVPLEAFMESNWNGVVGESPATGQSTEVDWLLLANLSS
jgi:hypothetical protein